MKITKRILFFVLIAVSYTAIYATGPSYIDSEIRPISINEKGEVLCRTRFEKNPMGAHTYMDIEYGLCVLTKNRIFPLSIQTLSYPVDFLNDDVYQEQRYYYDSIFTSVCFDAEVALELERLSVKNKYNFKACNISQYEINKTFLLSEFEKVKQVNLRKKHQQALHGGKGSCQNNKNIHVLYDFGDIIITQNTITMAEIDFPEETETASATFDYLVPLFGGIEYDLWAINGVLFLKDGKF